MKEQERETIRRARQTHLAEYLISKGEPLIRSGTRYRHADHESLVFTDNAFYWNSRNDKGNAVDFLMRHRDMDFNTAVYELTNATIGQESENDGRDSKKSNGFMLDIDIAPDMRRAIAYLAKARGIDYSIIKQLIDNKLLYQEVQKVVSPKTDEPIEVHNIVFPIYDENNVIVGAELQGTLTDPSKRFKGVKNGSKYGYGYNVNPTQSKKIKFVLFFESAVDLLSFWDIKKIEGKTLDNCLLVSLMGLKENVFRLMVSLFEGAKPYLCVDNDEAATSFTRIIMSNTDGVYIHAPEPEFKDWNDQLKAMRKVK
jgi:hypothetical protein